jgi:hypothetical protein
MLVTIAPPGMQSRKVASMRCRFADQPAAVVVVHRHAEAPRPARDGAADPPHAEDAETPAVHVAAQKLAGHPAAPSTAAHQREPLHRAPRRAQHEQQGDVGTGFAEHVRGAEELDSPRRERREIDMVGADRIGANDAEAWRQACDHRRIEQIGRGDNQNLRAKAARDEFIARQHAVGCVEDGIVLIMKRLCCGRRQDTGDEDARPARQATHGALMRRDTV